MSEVKRYEINGTFEVPETGQKLVNPKMVMESDFDRVTAERDAALGREAALREKLSTANGCLNEWRRSTLGRTLLENAALQQRLTAADEELDQCHSMALMIEEKEWAEHVGKGTISSRVESAFTQLHNELTEARQGLAAADERADVLVGLLREVVALDPHGEFLGWQLDGKIDAALKPAEGGGDEHCS